MKLENLNKNMADQIVEAQIKLGYSKETVTLYYPLTSLNGILGTSFENGEELKEALSKALEGAKEPFRGAKVTASGNRIGMVLPPEVSEYIYKTQKPTAFLKELISFFGENHHGTIEEISRIFAKYSEDYICEKMPKESDFDYVLYFPKADVDSYYYCIKMEMGHTIYHRFLKEDYEALT